MNRTDPGQGERALEESCFQRPLKAWQTPDLPKSPGQNWRNVSLPPVPAPKTQKVSFNPSCITRLLPEPTRGLPAATSGVAHPQPNVLEVPMSLVPPEAPP